MISSININQIPSAIRKYDASSSMSPQGFLLLNSALELLELNRPFPRPDFPLFEWHSAPVCRHSISASNPSQWLRETAKPIPTTMQASSSSQCSTNNHRNQAIKVVNIKIPSSSKRRPIMVRITMQDHRLHREVAIMASNRMIRSSSLTSQSTMICGLAYWYSITHPASFHCFARCTFATNIANFVD